MKVAIVTPLYPPDVDETATFVKELARRLARHHEVTLVTYGHMPEHISGVTIRAINKRQPTLIRIALFFFALVSVSGKNSVLYVINGPSVELPLLFSRMFSHTPYIFHGIDVHAHARTMQRFWRKCVEKIIISSAYHVLSAPVFAKPEILPFSPPPEKEITAYETAWHAHLVDIERIFSTITAHS